MTFIKAVAAVDIDVVLSMLVVETCSASNLGVFCWNLDQHMLAIRNYKSEYSHIYPVDRNFPSNFFRLITEKFFTPTLVFLLAEVSSIVGRVLSHKFLITHSNKWWYILCLLVRLICTPFYLFCNAQPRTHLPVIFDHDWEFVLGHIIFSSSTGFLMHVGFMSVRSLAEGKTEVGLKIVTLTLSLVSAASTFNGFLTVMLL
uniref:Equilibrative nucleoside transporter 1-like n=1 Tax=Diabrotica virgifera virgifera TaxID=50390 RepID=A0A6P7GCF3_DIAVI